MAARASTGQTVRSACPQMSQARVGEEVEGSSGVFAVVDDRPAAGKD